VNPTPPTRPGFWHIWWLASRPRTLPAAAAPVIAGSALAYYAGGFDLAAALAALLGALLIQIGTNFANDVFDYRKGADTAERVGPTRATSAGWVTPGQMLVAMVVAFGLATLCGLYLTWIGGWPIVLIGLASIAAGIAYTGGPFPLGYNGLGDVFVFIFFGLVAVAGTYYVQAGAPTALVWWIAVGLGLLCVNIIVVNNLRDVETDRKAGKRTLAVRFGPVAARWQYVACQVGAFAAALGAWLSQAGPPWVMATWLAIPLALRWARVVQSEKGRALNPALAASGQIELVYALLVSLGLVLARIF
jgi:1,4-dihydroxy-2-naphthoate octaprenyltransferase